MKMGSQEPTKKRKSTRDASVSPPPLRRKINRPSNDPAIFAPTTATSTPIYPTTPNTLSIVSWNVNGISHVLPPTQRSITSFLSRRSPQGRDTDSESEDGEAKKSPLRAMLKRRNFPALLCLQEVKIALKDETTQRAVEKAANTGPGPKYTAHFHLPRDKYNATGWGGKVYGVCTLVRNDLESLSGGAVETSGMSWDLEGRVLSTTFEGWKLVVVNGYWVNGTMNAWRNSSTGVVQGTRHDAKRKFHEHMYDFMKEKTRNGWHVVLTGDMNIAPRRIDGHPNLRLGEEHVRNRADFNRKFVNGGCPDGSAVDSFRHIHGDRKAYSYHGEKAELWGSSCDRVDLGIVTERLVNEGGLIGAEIWESVADRGGSDHLPIGVALDMNLLRRNIVNSHLQADEKHGPHI